MYVLNIAEDGRILAVFMKLPNGDYTGMPIVDEMPDGMPTDYMYVDGEFVYNPLPPAKLPEDKPENIEQRIKNLEAAMAAIEEGIASV